MAVTPTNGDKPAKTNMLKDIFINGNGGVLGAVARLGVTATLSLGLAGFLAWRVDAGIIRLEAAVAAEQAKMDAATISMRDYVATQTANQRVLRNLALQTCLNVAKNDTQNDACLRAAEK